MSRRSASSTRQDGFADRVPIMKMALNILYVPIPAIMHPWYDDFLLAIDPRHSVTLFDPERALPEQFSGIDVVVELGGISHTPEMIRTAVVAGVKLWQISGTGMDHVDIPTFHKLGLPVANTPGQFSAVAMAEHAFYFMLCFAKKHDAGQAQLNEPVWCLPMTEELHSATLGLIGFGNSAKQLARRATAFGMRIMAIDAVDVPPTTLAEHGVDDFCKTDELDHLLSASDFVSIHTPLLPSTHHLIGKREFEIMKPSSVLINVARGAIVDEEALANAVRDGQIGGAGLDAFSVEPLPNDHAFRTLENILITPHNGGGSRGTSRRRGQACAENIQRITESKTPLYLV